MRAYEHTFIARQDLSPQQAQALADTYAGVITEHGGEVTKNEYWGLRNLAYRIKKNRKGHYLHLNLRAPSAAIDELERQERLSDDVIRYLTVRVERARGRAVDDHAGALARARSARAGRTTTARADTTATGRGATTTTGRGGRRRAAAARRRRAERRAAEGGGTERRRTTPAT